MEKKTSAEKAVREIRRNATPRHAPGRPSRRRPARAGPQRAVRRLDARVHGEDAAHRVGAEHEKIHGR